LTGAKFAAAGAAAAAAGAGIKGTQERVILGDKETRIDWRQVWNDNLDAHRRKLPESPADQNNVEVQSNINEVVKQSKQCCDRRTSSWTYAVGHPQRRMIVYYDRYESV
jgi:hypothetical protein